MLTYNTHATPLQTRVRLSFKLRACIAAMIHRIEVLPYNPEWPGLFRAIGAQLREALGTIASRIDHIGSTAVPGLAAKPVIDIHVSVSALEPSEPFRIPLEALGYPLDMGNDDLKKRYFHEAPGSRETHIHVRRAGSWAEQSALPLRDYMREHETDVDRYVRLKERLARHYGLARRGYTNAKGTFIWAVLGDADRWAQEVGWEPDPIDA